jgi:hypothetical protein
MQIQYSEYFKNNQKADSFVLPIKLESRQRSDAIDKRAVPKQKRDAKSKFSNPRFNAFGMTPQERRVSFENKIETVLK